MYIVITYFTNKLSTRHWKTCFRAFLVSNFEADRTSLKPMSISCFTFSTHSSPSHWGGPSPYTAVQWRAVCSNSNWSSRNWRATTASCGSFGFGEESSAWIEINVVRNVMYAPLCASKNMTPIMVFTQTFKICIYYCKFIIYWLDLNHMDTCTIKFRILSPKSEIRT